MPDLGKYVIEVLSAYAVTIVLLAGLVWATWARSLRIRRELREVEERATNE